MIKFSELPKIVDGELIALNRDVAVDFLITDSRKAIVHYGSLFFAIDGEHHDGHVFIEELYKAGIRQFIIERDIDSMHFPESNFLRVKSSIQALQALVAHHRKNFSIPVIGITGSNGKTIVKEWLHQLISKEFNTIKNPGSYNSQLGVPLSVYQVQEHHQLGIFEAGVSKPNEMERLERVIQPTLGIFTTIGSAHNENFSTVSEKIEEKLKLFTRVERLIYCIDQQEVHQEILKSGIPTLTWGHGDEADIKISGSSSELELRYRQKEFSLAFPFSDHASIENALHCVALMLYLDYDQETIKQRILQLRAVAMRLELKEGINQCKVIDDTYNNDLGGLRISLDFLFNQKQKKHKSLILSDMFQTGLQDSKLVSEVARIVNANPLKSFIGIGPVFKEYSREFKGQTYFYKTTEDFLQHHDLSLFQNEVVLVKGARVFQFEKIVARLLQKVHGTVMEVDMGALVHNLNFFRAKLRPSTKLMVMVKAFAYGSGSIEVANVLQFHRVDYLGVAYADEGVELRRNNITLPIMVMNPSEEGFTSMMSFNLEPEMYSFKILKSFINFLEGRRATIHIKLNTGMNRLGFDPQDIDELGKILRANQNLKVASIFSHLAGSDEEEHDSYSRSQANIFEESALKINQIVGYNPLMHILNTPGILRLPDLQFNMVRLGIGLYGVDPTVQQNSLRTVATLKTVVSQIRHIKKGETIGYGRKGSAIQEMTVATIAIGYADGFSRAFSRGVGEVLINGKIAPVIGNVCMDMTMIDVTGITANEGDEVIIFGKQLSIYDVANKIGTIPYEILTNTSERVRRVFVAESI